MATLYHRSSEKKRIAHDFRRQEEEVIGSLCRLGSRPISPKTQLEQEKRIRREIANSNERRRMQSINAGFQSLRTLLPQHEGEKLSKAAILQHTAEYIYQLEQEKTRLLSQNCQLKRLVNLQINHDSDGSCSDSPLPKRKKIETIESSDEGIGNMSPSQSEPSVEDVRKEMIDLRVQLDRERRARLVLEEQMRNMDAQMYPERIREIAHQVQLHYQSGGSGDETFKPLGESLSMTLDAEMTSPPSQLSSEEVESSHEIIGAQPSPEHTVEVPEDLSGKSSSKSPPPLQHQVSIDEQRESITVKKEVLCDIPVTLDLPIPPMSIDTPVASSPAPPTPPLAPVAIPVAESSTSLLYPASTSRQNLETIVEAIRHLEGDHLFQDDPDPCHQPIELKQMSPVSYQERQHFSLPLTTESKIPFSCVSGEFAFHHQIIQNAPISQLRPGVIVSNHS